LIIARATAALSKWNAVSAITASQVNSGPLVMLVIGIRKRQQETRVSYTLQDRENPLRIERSHI
jgi:tRNA A22 N-methylase